MVSLRSDEKSASSTQITMAHFVPNCLHPVPRPPSLPNITREVHEIISCTIQKWLDELSQNPFSRAVHSLTSNFGNHILQVRRDWNQGFGNTSVLRNHNFAAVLPGNSVAGLVVANGVLSFLSLYNTLLVARLVLTWFPNAPSVIVSPLSTVCDPYLNIFRGIIPPLGGTLDLSPILAFLVLNVVSSTAQALPAELPPPGSDRSPNPSNQWLSPGGLTSMQRKWVKRFHGGKSH